MLTADHVNAWYLSVQMLRCHNNVMAELYKSIILLVIYVSVEHGLLP